MNLIQLRNRKTLDEPRVFSIAPEKQFNFCEVKVPDGVGSIQTEHGRFYTIPGIGYYPSATTVLGSVKNPAIEKWKIRVGPEECAKILRKASERGTRLHSAAENYLNGIVTETKYEETFNTFNKIKKVLNNHVDNIYMIESAVYSTELMIAGRIDLYADYEGVPSIIDFKTSLKNKKEEWIKSYFAQGYIYSQSIEELTGTRPENIIIIMASDQSEEAIIFKKSSRDINAKQYVESARRDFINSVRTRKKESN